MVVGEGSPPKRLRPPGFWEGLSGPPISVRAAVPRDAGDPIGTFRDESDLAQEMTCGPGRKWPVLLLQGK